MSVALVFGLAACSGDEDRVLEPVRIAYQFRVDDDRDSLSTPLDEGRYEVRIEGACGDHKLVLTEGGMFDNDYPVTDLVTGGLEIDGGRWRIRQPDGIEMPNCVGVVLYPEGLDAPPLQATTTMTTDTTTKAPSTTIDQQERVTEWVDAHLEDVALAHGSYVGLVDSARELRDIFGEAEALALCGTASESEIRFMDAAGDAISTYPGQLDLSGALTRLHDETQAQMERCTNDVRSLDSLEAWGFADTDLGLTVLEILDEAGHPFDPDAPLVIRYDEVRQRARDSKVTEIKTLALRNRGGG